MDNIININGIDGTKLEMFFEYEDGDESTVIEIKGLGHR